MDVLEDKFLARYQKLNEQQKKAVDAIDGPVLVIAGPGSGKTELLSLRVANILRLTDTHPSSILCLTFTDSAAINMRKRLAGLIGLDAYKVAIHTFHSFGTEIINRYPEFFYQGAHYKPADELVQHAIIEDILTDLKHNYALRSYHPQQGFTYLKDILKKISELKSGGLSPVEFKEILEENKDFLQQADSFIAEIFAERISKKTLELIPGLINHFKKIEVPGRLKPLPYESLKNIVVESLSAAYEEAFQQEKPDTKPLTEWKKKYLKKNAAKALVFCDVERVEKQLELCEVYEKYQEKLHEQGYFDFDDMLLDTVEALEQFPELRYNLQERYLYVLVDEFQDTNGVQMRLLDYLFDAEVVENRPNILAVGDDDQAIYKFQGANADNVLQFLKKYDRPELIVLQKNYRSTQPILDFVRTIILKGEDRLEKRLPEQVTKELQSANTALLNGEIVEKEFPTSLEELCWVAEMIQKKILQENVNPAEIAVIARKHVTLEKAAKILDYFGIPVAYERKKNLLEQPHIKELITLLKFVHTIATKNHQEADEYLPEILSFPFWKLDRIAVWKISIRAFQQRKLWLEVMLESESKIKSIAEFLIQLGIDANEKTAEEIIDALTGVDFETFSFDEEGALQSLEEVLEDKSKHMHVALAEESVSHTDVFQSSTKHLFLSPYKNFYFNVERFQNSKLEYLDLLQSLQAFMQKMREYKGTGVIKVADVIECLTLHEKHKLSLYYKSFFNNDEKAVNLLTAHKAKGLEFENVFLLHCQESEWIKANSINKLSFSSNLPLAPEAENSDDKLRLFYVALTRAKRNLYLLRHQYNDKGDEQIRLRFLEDQDFEKKKKENISLEMAAGLQKDFVEKKGLEKLLALQFKLERHMLRTISEDELLKGLLKDYKLSVTHLNNFLDIVEGGPQKFLEQNLLRFPKRISPSGVFGNAVHQVLHQFTQEFKNRRELPSVDFLLRNFETYLSEQRLNAKDYKHYLAKGRDQLALYYEKRKEEFHLQDQSEFDFKGQGIVLGGAEITGKIDKMRYDQEGREILVYDYKTGKPLKDWNFGQSHEKIKAWKYRNQLVFYKLLVEHARDFRGYKVRKGILEFLEPVQGEIKTLSLDISQEETDKMRRLVQVVYRKIMNLDFPDVSGYDRSLEGIISFSEDLLAEAERGKVAVLG